jgi:DNA-binding Lrp family transcriptional regulator
MIRSRCSSVNGVAKYETKRSFSDTSVDRMSRDIHSSPEAAMPQLDDIDRAILSELQRDGRLSVSDLSLRVSVSRATAYARLKRLRDDGAIRGVHADVDPVKVGLGIGALILGDVEQASWREIRAQLLALPGVEYVALTSGGHDFLLLARAPDLDALRDLVLLKLHDMAEVRTTHTMLILEEHHPSMGMLR